MTKGKVIQARSIFRANECDAETGEELHPHNDKVLQTFPIPHDERDFWPCRCKTGRFTTGADS